MITELHTSLYLLVVTLSNIMHSRLTAYHIISEVRYVDVEGYIITFLVDIQAGVDM